MRSSCKLCDRDQITARGLCERCYRTNRNAGTLEDVADPPLVKRGSFNKKSDYSKHCLECGRAGVNSRGLCATHYQYAQRAGTLDEIALPAKADRSRLAIGERRRNSEGYVAIGTEKGARREHRTVMEGILGRPLAKGENVHHKNGVRHDNRPENLELWYDRGSQPSGQRVIDLVEYIVAYNRDLVIKELERTAD